MRVRSLVWLLLLALPCLAQAPDPPSTPPIDPVPPPVVVMPPMRARVDDTEKYLGEARMLARSGKLTEAERAYRELLGKQPEIPPNARLAALIEMIETQRRLQQVNEDRHRRAMAEERARALLRKAKALRDAGRYEEAGAACKAVVAMKEEIAPSLYQQGFLGLTEAEEQSVVASHGFAGFVRGLEEISRTLASWLVILAVFGGTLVLLGWVSRGLRPRKGTLLVLEDLTVAEQERSAANEILTQDWLRQIAGDHVAGDELTFQPMEDLAGANLAAVKPEAKLASMDPFLASTTISVGPLSFAPKALVGLFGGIFRRPHEATVSGSVSRHENHWVMLVRTLNSRGQPIAGRTWCAEDSGPGARERVIRRAAACVLVSEGKYPVTRNADSLAELAEARRLLAGRPGEAELREAGRALRRSLTRDPFNWLARFELAVVSRQLGDYEEAVGACEQLEAQVEEERAKLSDPDSHLGRFLQSEPALASYIRYNRALALSKMERWPEHNQAKILLDELADGRDTSIRCLARSAQAATLLFEFDEIEEEADNDEDRARYQQRRYEIEEKVREIVKEVDRDVHEQTERANRAWALARAVAHNALGYVLMELKPVRKEAPEQFRLAAALAPSFIEPHLNLGRWHRRRDALEGEQRFFKVVGALDRAKEINPANRDYLYQMGRLMADPGVARYDEALEFFSKAEPHAKAAFEQGQVYLNSDYSGWSLEKAAAAFRRSLALRPSQGRRVAKLVATLVKLGDREARVDRKTLARRYFEEALGLAHKAVRNRDVSASAQKWLAKIEEDMRRRLEDLETRGDRVNFGLVE